MDLSYNHQMSPNRLLNILSAGVEKGVIWTIESEFQEFWVVDMIIRHKFGLESSNLYQSCILDALGWYFKMG